MSELDKYISRVEAQSGEAVATHLRNTVSVIAKDCLDNFDYVGKKNGVLLGHVQSGKTGNLIGLIASSIDHKFKFFLFLTSDSVLLYEQTLKRVGEMLPEVCVCGEEDDEKFISNALKAPCVLVLKKNQSVLRKWLSRILSIENSRGEPLLLIDDEADAASLNTKVNKGDISTINGLIRALITVSPCSLYLQTTATPFGNLLLGEDSTTKPSFITRFEPSDAYMGGEFFYGEEGTAFSLVDESEGVAIIDPNINEIPSGFKGAVRYFIALVIHAERLNINNCNFLIHPSHRISDHEVVATKVLRLLAQYLDEAKAHNPLLLELLPKPDGFGQSPSFEEIKNAIGHIKVAVVNSENQIPVLDHGYNIVVGGNCLGRGLTIPKLNVCYYTRLPKSPQADTLLQHSRIFGYDRDRANAKVFLTQPILLRFRGIVNGVTALHNAVASSSTGNIKYYLPPKVNPTRKNVIDTTSYISLVGGVNYFLSSTDPSCAQAIDSFIANIEDASTITIDILTNLLTKVESEDDLLGQFRMAVDLLVAKGDPQEVLIYKRVDRSIGKNTGTMLSPDDRLLSKKHLKKTIIFLYRILGEESKGWSGRPLWLINIRFPENYVFIGSEG